MTPVPSVFNVMHSIDISNRQSVCEVDERRLRDAVGRVLTGERIAFATISLALVDDSEIHRINREFLGHDYPTDVISFRLGGGNQETEDWRQETEAGVEEFETDALGQRAASLPPLNPQPSTFNHLDGELIVSTETAQREAAAHGWTVDDELLLYVVHGMLHLCGYDDLTDEARPIMRAREREVLSAWQLVPTGLEA